MSVYVDPPADHVWCLYGRYVDSCHMWADTTDELDEFATRLALKLSWRHRSRTGLLHYDLVVSKRKEAVEAGAIELTFQQAAASWRALRAEEPRLDPR